MKSTVGVWSGSYRYYHMSEISGNTALLGFNTMFSFVGGLDIKNSNISSIGSYIFSCPGDDMRALSEIGGGNFILSRVSSIGE